MLLLLHHVCSGVVVLSNYFWHFGLQKKGPNREERVILAKGFQYADCTGSISRTAACRVVRSELPPQKLAICSQLWESSQRCLPPKNQTRKQGGLQTKRHFKRPSLGLFFASTPPPPPPIITYFQVVCGREKLETDLRHVEL